MAEGKTWQNVCVTIVTGLLLSGEFCHDPLKPILCSGRKRSVLRSNVWQKAFSNNIIIVGERMKDGNFFFHNYCYACHTRFGAFFPSLFFCISSLLSINHFYNCRFSTLAFE